MESPEDLRRRRDAAMAKMLADTEGPRKDAAETVARAFGVHWRTVFRAARRVSGPPSGEEKTLPAVTEEGFSPPPEGAPDAVGASGSYPFPDPLPQEKTSRGERSV